MRPPVLLLPFLLLPACATVKPLATRQESGTPPISLVHLAGTIMEAPQNSLWPPSVKKGAPYDVWVVIDNRVRDGNSDPHQSSFIQKSWPARYDFTVGDVHFSSDQIHPPNFNVQILSKLPHNDDGYSITPLFGGPIAAAPNLSGVVPYIRLKTRRTDLIMSDALPLRAWPLKYFVNGTSRNFNIAASENGNVQNVQNIAGDANLFEVFQAWQDSPTVRSRKPRK